MNLFNLIGQIFKPAAELVDNLHTSEAEKLAAKAGMLQTQTKFLEYALDYESKQLEAKARIIEAESKSDSWITRSWRPILMLTFGFSAIAHWFGLTPDTLDPETVDDLFDLVKIGVGGYIGGRSVEKVVPAVIGALKKKEEV